jgi:eukaryotic-like serine/threonine-protein kinase
LPVTHVAPEDAEAYCQWLSEHESTKYRLPTEAEWEYACRAGTTTQFSFGDDEGSLSTFAWTGANSRDQPHAVGGKDGNQFGLHDMHGNLGELCQDRYDVSWYVKSPTIDPLNVIDGNRSVVRGSAWRFEAAAYFRSATRSFYFVKSPAYHRQYGFRVVGVL